MITCGQVPSVPWYVLEGFNTMRSAPRSASKVLLQIYLETWSLRWERPSAEEHIWHFNSMTSPFLLFFSLFIHSLCLFLFIIFFLQTKRRLRAYIKFWPICTIWYINCGRPVPFFIFYSFAFLNLIIHLSPTTWTEWHHLGLHLIIPT